MFKKSLFQIHWFLGITAGLILSLMGVTGAIFSYDQQILQWINTDSYVVEAQPQAKMTPAELYQYYQQHYPETKVNSITVAASPTTSSTVNIQKEGERRGYNQMVNPYTAAILPEVKGREFFQFIQQLHRYLTAGEVGKQITAASTLMLLFFIFSGLYLRWPKKHTFKQWFAVKPKLKGRNFIWDLHAVVGTWVILFYLVFATTGLYWSYDWWRDGMFKVMGVERPQMQGMKPPRPEGGAAANKPQQKGNGNLRNRERGPEADAQLSNMQIQQALTQSWSSFTQTYKTAYSSVTFNLPKEPEKVEISFVDPIPQHERARNSTVYNLQQHSFEQTKLYEDKKLNEKIMSSMLPVHRGSFFGPIWHFMAMLASLAMPLFFVTGWMLYLKRRKQKKLTQAARAALAPMPHEPSDGASWLIVYATQTGTAEELAWLTATSLQDAKQTVQIQSMQKTSLADLQNAKQVLFVVSTYGTGEAPDLAQSFVKNVMSETANLAQLRYAVLALGSKEYPDSYCQFGHQLAQWLTRAQAQPLFELIEVDNASKDDLEQWQHALAEVTDLELQRIEIQKTFDDWTLCSREHINPSSLGDPIYHLQLQTSNDILWQAGDIAEVQPCNSTARITDFLSHADFTADDWVKSEGCDFATALQDKNLTTPLPSFSTTDEIVKNLAVLPVREYSIASIPKQGHLDLVIRLSRDKNGAVGLGSGWLCEHAAVGQTVQMRIRTNESFHIINDNRPIIFIGNGTGIAGLMSLLQQRAEMQYSQNWLIFGERQREHDFLFETTLTTWLKSGHLQQLDLAFSRDQAEKIYVQDVLRQHAAQVKRWIDQDAVLYICGSIEGMATGVEQALIEILGADELEQLREQGRYRRDVY
ncbi:sulfite reductase flavoprotein subunit alpha [Acinetobacter sp. MD2(2019)]|uniref:sulfite reductase flavoprotein subunit alpha n=1 Tax=Acinetobacter sp. MD2(2019) TaxID=2605273 RepID=UPI002D1F6FEC|nr:sulfite reductase flavoprotein subunit alpha [Acinetobacter sp. MD2(2019)]MEB3753975.1 sulfite reductase flavoprotein subunit alpha [Acinetobacter sp. MD2(2019)]